MDQGKQAQQAQESRKRSLSYLGTTNQPIPAFSLHPRGWGDSWLADGWRKHFIDFCVGHGKDLIGMWKFLTPVSGSQQGWCCERQPRLSHPLPNTDSCWEYAVGKGDSSQRDVLAVINHTLRGSAIPVLLLDPSSPFGCSFLNKLLLVYEVLRG